MSHLSRDRLLDAVEGVLDPQAHAHLSHCARCRAAVDGLEATLNDVRAVEVPEPSPLFWDHLSARVRDAIASEPVPQDRGGRWRWGWQPAAGLLALLAIVAAAALLMPMRWRGESVLVRTPASTHATDASHDPLALDADEDWQFVVAVAHGAGEGSLEASGIDARPGATELVVTDLSADEQRELVRLLNQVLAARAHVRRRPEGDV
jgi:hypothetical protein